MNCIFLRRGYGEIKPAINYVEWIKGDGSSYFDTGFKPNQNTRVVMKARHPSTTKELFYFGARNGYMSGAFDVRVRNNSAAWQIEYAGSSTTMSADYTQMQTVDFNKNVFSVGTTSKSFTAATFQCNYNLYLFALNNVGSAANIAPELYVEQCQIYDNGTLVKDYRAAKDAAGAACFYDEVSQSYEYGKGTFTAGASISGGGSGGGASEYTVSIAQGGEYLYHTTINGVKYINAQSLTIPKGTAVTVWISDAQTASYITLNGTQVAKVGSGGASYTFVPSSNVSITYPTVNGVATAAITTS